MTNPHTDSCLMATTASLMVLSRAYRSVADSALSAYGLSQATAWPVILTGRLGDGVRQGALAEALGVEGPSLVRVLDQLVSAGLIERREDPHDRRARTIHLTPDGHALREQVEGVLVKLRREIFKDVSHEDLQACMRVFDTLKSALGRDDAVPMPKEPQP